MQHPSFRLLCSVFVRAWTWRRSVAVSLTSLQPSQMNAKTQGLRYRYTVPPASLYIPAVLQQTNACFHAVH